MPALAAAGDCSAGAGVKLLCLLLIAGAVLGAYASVFVANYGYADDYLLLQSSMDRPLWLQEIYERHGRPLLGYATRMAMNLAGSVQNLRLIRLGIGVQLFVLCAVACFHLMRQGAKPALAVLVAVFIATSPTFQIQVSWATYVVMAAMAALTWLTYRLASVSLRLTSWRFYAGQIGAILLTAVVMAVYQPAVAFYWFWFGAEVLLAGKPLREDLWKLVRLGVPFVLGGLAYFVWWKLQGIANPRAGLESDLLAKQGWFWGEVLPSTFNFHMFAWPWWLGVGIAAAAAIVVLVLGDGRWWARLGKMAIFALLLPGSYVANLAVQAKLPTYRTRMALMSLAALLVCYALWLAIKPLARWHRLAPVGVAALLGLVLVARASYSVNYYIVWPQSIEYALVKSQLRPLDFQKHRQVHLIHNRFVTPFTPDRYTMEFGVPTSNMPSNWLFGWAMTAMAMKELHPDRVKPYRQVEIKLFEFKRPPEPDPQAVVVDMRQLQTFR